MNTFSCTLPPNESKRHPFVFHSSYACRSACKDDPCWWDPSQQPLTMICTSDPVLSDTFEGFQGEEVRPTNHPSLQAATAPTDNPLHSQPWRFELQGGETCFAGFPDPRFRRRGAPILGYGCDTAPPNVVPGGPIDRSKPLWTVHAATNDKSANAKHYPLVVPIAQAWFIGRGPTHAHHP